MNTQCQNCTKLLNIPDAYERKIIKCPSCKRPFQAFPEIEKEPIIQTKSSIISTPKISAREDLRPEKDVKLETSLSELSKEQEQIEIKVRCSGCGNDFMSPAYHGGKKTKCPSCGQAISISLQDRETKKCPMCSEEILVTAKKCKHCGEVLEFSSIEKTEAKDDNKLDIKWNFWLLGFVAFTLVFGILIVEFVEKKPELSDSDKELVRKVIYEAEMLYGSRYSGDNLYDSREIQFRSALRALDELKRDNLTAAIIRSLQSTGSLFATNVSGGRLSYRLSSLELNLGNNDEANERYNEASNQMDEAREKQNEFIKEPITFEWDTQDFQQN